MNKIISEVSTRIEVTSLADALPTYRTLAGTDDVHRFQFPEFALAVVGPFMLLEGDRETLAKYRRSATLIVTDMAAAVDAFTSRGGAVIDGPGQAGAGVRAIVEDRDGNVFECFQRSIG